MANIPLRDLHVSGFWGSSLSSCVYEVFIWLTFRVSEIITNADGGGPPPTVHHPHQSCLCLASSLTQSFTNMLIHSICWSQFPQSCTLHFCPASEIWSELKARVLVPKSLSFFFFFFSHFGLPSSKRRNSRNMGRHSPIERVNERESRRFCLKSAFQYL